MTLTNASEVATLEYFQPEVLKKYVIDPRRAAMSSEKADQERTDLFRKAVTAILGLRYSESRYRYFKTG